MPAGSGIGKPAGLETFAGVGTAGGWGGVCFVVGMGNGELLRVMAGDVEMAVAAGEAGEEGGSGGWRGEGGGAGGHGPGGEGGRP